jgi:hypothetical protein
LSQVLPLEETTSESEDEILLSPPTPETMVLNVSDSTFEISYISFVDNDKFSNQFKMYKLGEFDYLMYKGKLYEKASEHIDVAPFRLRFIRAEAEMSYKGF